MKETHQYFCECSCVWGLWEVSVPECGGRAQGWALSECPLLPPSLQGAGVAPGTSRVLIAGGRFSSAGCAQLLGREGADAWHVAGTPQGLGLAHGLGCGPEFSFLCWMSDNICIRVEQGVEIHLTLRGMRGCRVGVSQHFGVRGGLHVGTPTHGDRALCVGGVMDPSSGDEALPRGGRERVVLSTHCAGGTMGVAVSASPKALSRRKGLQ